MDNDKVTEFLGRFVTDLAATGSAGSAVVGNRLGLYRALAQSPATPEEFAERAGCAQHYLPEWLNNQAAGGYVSYDPATGRYWLTEEQAFCLADPNGPNVSAAFLIALATCAPNRRSRFTRFRRVAQSPFNAAYEIRR